MRKNKDQAFLEYEIKKYDDFFYVYNEILNGVIMRKHFVMLFNGHYKEKLKEWERIGLIEIKTIGHKHIILLRHCSALGVKHRPELTGLLLLRSILRMEYYLALGLKTPTEIRQYSTKGNNKVNRQGASKGFLSRYRALLHGLGVELPSLEYKTSIDALNRLVCHNIFIAKVQLKDNTIIPNGVFLAAREDNGGQIAKELIFAYRELVSLFSEYPSPTPVKPKLITCTFLAKDPSTTIFKKMRQEHEFSRMTDNELFAIFPVLIFESPFPYLDPTKLV